MNRTVFFDRVRARPFGGSLSQPQVEGLTAILDAAERHSVKDTHHVADILAQVHHETGGYMLGIKETVYASHTDKNPSDATVKARLEAAWAKGRLSWVKTPYWRDGWFGRGPIQITHLDNYRKFEKRLGIPLTKNPSLALDPVHGADIAVVGMSEGLFTGKKLADFKFPAALSAQPKDHPRRIVNGADGTDSTIAKTHADFYAALEAAGWGKATATITPPPPERDYYTPADVHPPAAQPSWLANLVSALIAIFKRSAK
ncbi:glycoside hydrolase family 19 protein [Ancylobacter polymorphus]|uniref:Glycoside hydrolase family 19 catalytic domain-containing protein n=1 Tax=Ancylobacter polymorphus TaxID=223390 RepID=A0A9E6ZU15_9HYPH|nr:glycoside hydrolase family 19 protein [Ancylobacter polymorphus]UOK71726.1 hypothetical protein K9D25_03085 [Ancylobacter polymorphus]